MNKYLKIFIVTVVNYFFWLGIYDNLFNKILNACEMTYMYEYPEYIEVDVPDNFVNGYKLYVYGEGQYARMLYRKDFTGIPVLFIPGNQGSSKQVRSLASVGYRMAQTYKTSYHFDYFAVEFNEEMGALFGPVLNRQTQFVARAINTILELYQNQTNRPQSVVLVGHSMGGLVARAVVSLPDFIPNSVSIIITEATPHARPVVALDMALLTFSEQITAYWAQERYLKLRNIVFVTIGGGKSDIQVPSTLTTSEFADVDETLLSVPMCWLTTDHLAIVWCRQLVLAISRALFSSVEKSNNLISTDTIRIITNFKSQLSQKLDENVPYQLIQQRISHDGVLRNDFIEVKHLPYVKKIKEFREQLFVIKLKEDSKHKFFTVLFTHVDYKTVLFACNIVNNTEKQLLGPEYVQLYPKSIPRNRKEVNIELTSLKERNFTHVVALIHSTNDQTTFSVDASDGESRQVRIVAPKLASSFLPIPLATLPKKSLSLNVTIEGFTEFWQSYTLRLTPIGSCPVVDQPVVSIRSSWLDRWEYLTRRNNSVFDYNLELDVPSAVSGKGTVDVHIVKLMTCSYSVSLQKNLRGVFERITLLYFPQIATYFVSHLLLILANQYKALSKGNKVSFYSHLASLSPISIVPLMKILSLILTSYPGIETDKSYLERTRTDIEILPIGLFVSALPVTLLFSSVLKVLLYGFSLALHRFVPRHHSQESASPQPINLSSILISKSSVCVVALLALGTATCGTVALFFASALYFIKVLIMGMSEHGRSAQPAIESSNTVSSEEPPSVSESPDIPPPSNDERQSVSESPDIPPPSNDEPPSVSESLDIPPPSNDERQSVSESPDIPPPSNDEPPSVSESPDIPPPTDSQPDEDTVSVPETPQGQENPDMQEGDLVEAFYEIQTTLMILIFVVSLLNLPSFIAWIKNLRFGFNLDSDPSLMVNYIIVGSLPVLWHIQNFKLTKKCYGVVGYVLHFSSAANLLFCSFRLFRISQIVSCSFVFLSIFHLFASTE